MGSDKEIMNWCRELYNKTHKLGPKNKGYLPPVKEVVEIRNKHGTIVIDAEYFRELPKAKQKKLMKW